MCTERSTCPQIKKEILNIRNSFRRSQKVMDQNLTKKTKSVKLQK